MKTYNVTYKDGRFFEIGTDRPISLLPDTGAILIVEKEQDMIFGAQQVENFHPVSSQSKLADVQRDSYHGKYKKVLDAGAKLYFIITIERSKRMAEVVLLEDLYFYNSRTSSSLNLSLYECICECVHIEGIEMKKPIQAPSVSDLFKRVYIHYNGNKGNPARNAFTTFFVDRQNLNHTLDWLRKQVSFPPASPSN